MNEYLNFFGSFMMMT